jgi:hypothetical protein
MLPVVMSEGSERKRGIEIEAEEVEGEDRKKTEERKKGENIENRKRKIKIERKG